MYFTFIYVYVSMCKYTHTCADAQGGQKREPDPLEVEL